MGATIDTVEVQLECGNTVLIDADCLEIINSHKWRYLAGGRPGNCYVVRMTCDKQGKSKRLYLHRVISKAGVGDVVDHINGNPLDNRRLNLRVVSHAENMRNRKKHADGSYSRFKGVSKFRSGKFRALIRDGSKQRYLGSFLSEVEAAFAYDCASLAIHGDFGRRNFLPLC